MKKIKDIVFKSKIEKKKVIFSLPVAIAFPHGFLGALCGYFSAKFLSPRLPSLVFDFGKIKLHLHHWLYSFLILIFGVRYDLLPLFPFSFGFLGGVIFQGIYCYDDWHQVIIFKKRNLNVSR